VAHQSSLVLKIERDVIARGVFTSLADRRKLMKYIRHYNKVPNDRERALLRHHTPLTPSFRRYSHLLEEADMSVRPASVHLGRPGQGRRRTLRRPIR